MRPCAVEKIEAPAAGEPDREKNSSLKDTARRLYESVAETLKPAREHVRDYLGLMEGSEQALADALEGVANAHKKQPDIYNDCHMLARWSREELARLRKIIERYGEAKEAEPGRLRKVVSPKLKKTGLGLLRDLHDCWLLAQETNMSLIVLDQAAKALRDKEMQELIERVEHQNERQRDWLKNRIKQAAPQALTVPS